MSFSDAPISFPGLFGDCQFSVPSKALNIGNGIYWYGIIIAAGMLLGLYFCMKQAHKYGLTEDNVIDTVLWVIPFSIIGARIYYVLFYLDLFRGSDGSINWSSTYRIWDGGLAIYGGVIAGFLTAYLFSRRRKISFWALADCCVQGLFIGQAIGRWGNFMNREAFGAATELPWRMRLWTSATTYMDVHPTFLYESLWNVIGLLLLYFVVSRARRFDGENTTIRLILNALSRDGGTVAVYGKDNRALTPLEREDIGAVLDEVGLPEYMTARQIGRMMAGIFARWQPEVYRDYLRRLALPEDKTFRDFSRGMKMKLGLAAALSHQPKLLLLDEATSGLDPVVRDEILTIFSDFTRDEEHAVLLSSHIVSDLEKICDYIAFLHKGRLLLCEEKDRLTEEYGILRGGTDGIAPAAVCGRHATPYGTEYLVRRDAVPVGMALGQVNIEDLFVFMAKEA